MADERDVESANLSTPRNDSEAPPPSYDSLYGRLKSVPNEASGPGDFFVKVCGILCASAVATICLAPVLAIPIAMIAVGAIHKDNCPIEKYIPIYLIVGGVFGLVQGLLTLSLRVKNHKEPKSEEGEQGRGFKDSNERPNPGSGIISCFLFAWFIAGSVWVYRIYGDVNTTNPDLRNYCHPSAYWFAFWLITLGYVTMALSCCCVAFCGILACIFSKK